MSSRTAYNIRTISTLDTCKVLSRVTRQVETYGREVEYLGASERHTSPHRSHATTDCYQHGQVHTLVRWRKMLQRKLHDPAIVIL